MPGLSVDGFAKKREEARAEVSRRNDSFRGRITVHMGTCGIAAGAGDVLDSFKDEIGKDGIRDVRLSTSGCAGMCSMEPMVTVESSGGPVVLYGDINPEKAARILKDHVQGGSPVREFALGVGPELAEIPFFRKQKTIVLRNRGVIDPDSIDEYIARDGYSALEKVLRGMKPGEVVEEVKKSGLRGRGGAGFPTGKKWEICRAEQKFPKYLIGNCDEGDPGAYMDRSIFESDPHAVIEGMTIAAYAVGASHGYFYIRTEYPLAIKSAGTAISQATEHGLLGSCILGSDFSFDIEIREGSGAFVCGEESSLIHSIEGVAPEPRQRPPFPVQVGIWGCPTVINNVETLATLPAILRDGADWFSGIGTKTSKGTKIFSLVGAINNTGLIEVPMGITLREVIYEIGGGIQGNKKFKAVQTGGPSGGCLPESMIDLPVDYESLAQAGSMMGSGGMIVIGEDSCMVDIAKFFVRFTNDESCGKCVTCRDGSDALLEVLTRITEGEGRQGDMELLDDLCMAVKDASMCGLGATLPNPVLSTMKYFREEYEAHIAGKKCAALSCRSLIRYHIVPEKCNGCRLCLKNCPVGAISGELKHIHVIDQAKCTRCNVCLEVCPPKVAAVIKASGDDIGKLHVLEKPVPVETFREKQ